MNRNPKFMSIVFFGAWIFLVFFLYDMIISNFIPPEYFLPAWPTVVIWYGILVAITKLKTKKPLNVFAD